MKSNLVEGYGRRNYKNEYIRLITFALASNDETIDHLETLYETESLTDEKIFKQIDSILQILGKKINKFLQSVQKQHRSTK